MSCFPGCLRRSAIFNLAALALVIGLSGIVAGKEDDSSEITAVLATVHNGYGRSKQTDGTFKPETFAFGEGGFTGTPIKDKSVDEQSFRKIAEVIAPSLTRLGYVSSHEPGKTNLLIMVYWGTTGTDQSASGGYNIGAASIPPPPPPPQVISTGRGGVIVVQTPPPPRPPSSNPDQAAYDAASSAQNRKRDQENSRNAQLLGYDEELARSSLQEQSRHHLDLVDEVEDTRYFVILRAYDFQTIWKEKKQKLLWEVRYSIRAHGHLFDEALASMTNMASRYFGQESKGLVRKPVPVGRVDLGDTIFKGVSDPVEKK